MNDFRNRLRSLRSRALYVASLSYLYIAAVIGTLWPVLAITLIALIALLMNCGCS